jgi:hypothetical protein
MLHRDVRLGVEGIEDRLAPDVYFISFLLVVERRSDYVRSEHYPGIADIKDAYFLGPDLLIHLKDKN